MKKIMPVVLLTICCSGVGYSKSFKPAPKSAIKKQTPVKKKTPVKRPAKAPQPKPKPTQAVKPLSSTQPLYQNNFEKAPVGKAPQEFLILGGEFSVVKDGANTMLELAAEPLDSFGLLFGPTVSSDASVSARINSTSKGRRHPAFGVGLYGVTGYKLRVTPGNGTLDVMRDEEVKASVPFEWKSGTWTTLRLQVHKLKTGSWKIEGKAWAEGTEEPKSWMISAEDKEQPPLGRPSLWGMPYAGTAIRFDDLLVNQPRP